MIVWILIWRNFFMQCVFFLLLLSFRSKKQCTIFLLQKDLLLTHLSLTHKPTDFQHILYKHASLYCKQQIFSAQHLYCSPFKWIETQMLPMCGLLHIDIILRRFIFFIFLSISTSWSFLCLIYVICFSLMFLFLLQWSMYSH